MVQTIYTYARVSMSGLPPVYCDGLKITDKLAVENEYAGDSSTRISQTVKKRTVEFELLNPRDHLSLYDMIERCRKGENFTVTGFGKDLQGNFRALERVDGAVVLDKERTIGNFDAVKTSFKGTADSSETLAASYA